MIVGTIEYVASYSVFPTWRILEARFSRTKIASPIVNPQAASSEPKSEGKRSGSFTFVRYGTALIEYPGLKAETPSKLANT